MTFLRLNRMGECRFEARLLVGFGGRIVEGKTRARWAGNPSGAKPTARPGQARPGQVKSGSRKERKEPKPRRRRTVPVRVWGGQHLAGGPKTGGLAAGDGQPELFASETAQAVNSPARQHSSASPRQPPVFSGLASRWHTRPRPHATSVPRTLHIIPKAQISRRAFPSKRAIHTAHACSNFHFPPLF